MADAVPPPTAGTSLADAPCTVRCWHCGQWFGSPEDFGPEAEYTCAKCWSKIEFVDRSVDLPPPPNRIPWWHRTVSGLVLALCTVTCAGVCWLVSWLAMCVLIGGCAFAPFPDGRGGGVLGVSVGPDGTVDTSGITGGLATLLGIGAAVGVPGVGGVALLVGKFVKAATDRANLLGKEAGWNEREAAASIQAPMPGPVAVAASGPGPAGVGVHATRTEVTA